MATRNKVVTASTNSDRVIDTITQAFGADPAARWLYPDDQQYLEFFPRFIAAFAGRAFEQSSADRLEDYSGAALWLPPEVRPDEDALVSLMQRTVPKRDQADAFSLLEQMESYHPAEPHWYLAMIGVEPANQGNGYGSALLKYGLERCDRDGKVAYLESSNVKNIALYERHGFERIGTIQIGSSPPIFPMVRKPQAS